MGGGGGLGFRVQGSGFRVQGSGFRVQGLGFRVNFSGRVFPCLTFLQKPEGGFLIPPTNPET